MSVDKFVKVGILLLNDSWFRLFCNSYMFGVVICHICAFISNRTRTFGWMIVSFLNYIWNYLKFIWLFLKLICTIWKSIWLFLKLIWTIWNSFGFFWIRPEKGVDLKADLHSAFFIARDFSLLSSELPCGMKWETIQFKQQKSRARDKKSCMEIRL